MYPPFSANVFLPHDRTEPHSSSSGGVSSSSRCQGQGGAFGGTLEEEDSSGIFRRSSGGGGGSRGWGSREGSRSLTPPALGKGGSRAGRGGGSAHSSPAKGSLLPRSNGPEVGLFSLGFLLEKLCAFFFVLNIDIRRTDIALKPRPPFCCASLSAMVFPHDRSRRVT